MLTLWLALLAPLDANNPTPVSRRPEEWVRLLGDDSFLTRQEAHDQLARLSMDAFGALTTGLAGSDPEVTRRCRQLLDQLKVRDLEKQLEQFKLGKSDLPGYKRYAKVVPSLAWGRDFFAEMWKTNPQFLADIEENPERAGAQVVGQIQNIQQVLYGNMRARGGQPGQPSVSEVASLLFAAQHPRAMVDIVNLSQLNNFLQHPVIRAAILEEKEGGPGAMRLLLVAHIRAHLNDQTAQVQSLHLCMNLNLKEGKEVGMVILKNPKTNQHTKGLACAVIAKMGTVADAPVLTAVLDDAAHINQFQVGPRGQDKGITEVRDVALSMLVSLTGQSHKDYGFAFAQQGAQFQHFNTYNMGFISEKLRREALLKWKAYAASRPELQPATPLKETPADEKKDPALDD